MASTNKDIIATYKIMNNIPIDKPLYTFAVWRSKGRMVKKGEKCKHRVTMWKHSDNTIKDKDGNEKPTNYCFHKVMYLFEENQTEEIVK